MEDTVPPQFLITLCWITYAMLRKQKYLRKWIYFNIKEPGLEDYPMFDLSYKHLIILVLAHSFQKSRTSSKKRINNTFYQLQGSTCIALILNTTFIQSYTLHYKSFFESRTRYGRYSSSAPDYAMFDDRTTALRIWKWTSYRCQVRPKR